MTSIVVERQGRVAVVTRSSPPLNLTTLNGTRDLDRVLGELADDRDVGVVVMTGAGDRFFGAGSDLTEFAGLHERGDVTTAKMAPENACLAFLEEMPKPTIAALNGTALGGGLELALCCDLIVADAGSLLGLPEINLGLFPGDGGPVRVTRRIGAARAKRLMFFGEPVPAETALEWGLIDELVPAGHARPRAVELAQALASKPAGALAACKQAISASNFPTSAEIAHQALPLFEQVFRSRDGVEGVCAFLAKEQPRFGDTTDGEADFQI